MVQASTLPGEARFRATGSSYHGDGLLCALLVAFCILVAHPFVEMGFIDDWSYVKTTQVFAQTGHFVYNGWATSTLGWQVLWGALFAKLFGSSFVVIRLSMLPVATASVYLFHRILLSLGTSRGNALFGTLALALSPLFIGLSASYMMDVPGLFCTLLCLYLCQCAIAAKTDRVALTWLSLAILTNVAGGTARQTAWLGVLLIVPSTLWLVRGRRLVLQAGIQMWLIGVACVFGWMRWFNQQPYFLPERPFAEGVTLSTVAHAIFWEAKAFLCLLVLVFPVLAAWLPLARLVPRRWLFSLSVALSVLLGGT